MSLVILQLRNWKTPFVKHIALELIKRGYALIVSRGYGGKFKETLQVTEDTPVKNTGDEVKFSQIKYTFLY